MLRVRGKGLRKAAGPGATGLIPMRAPFLAAALRPVVDAVYPPACCACGGPVCRKKSGAGFFKNEAHSPVDGTGNSFSRVMGPVLCDACIKAFTPITPPLCPVCGNMFVSRDAEDHVCGACADFPRRFGRARAAGAYEASLMAAVHKFKYAGCTGLAGPLGMLLFLAFLRWYDPEQVDLVTPVPLHRGKLRKRGFNQSFLMIRRWHRQATAAGTAFPGEKIKRDLLVRTVKTRSQTELSRKERMLNVKGAFALTDPSAVAGKRVLVVDDVFTTGATVNECARVLLAGGAKQVNVLTLARVNR